MFIHSRARNLQAMKLKHTSTQNEINQLSYAFELVMRGVRSVRPNQSEVFAPTKLKL